MVVALLVLPSPFVLGQGATGPTGARPLPPPPGSVPLRSQVRHYVVRGRVTPRFASPRGFDPEQLVNLGAQLARFAPELWSCTRLEGRPIDPSVAAALPSSFADACFYEGYETLTVASNDSSTGYSRLFGGGYVPTSTLQRRRGSSEFHGGVITDGRLPDRIARDGDTVRFGDAAAGLESERPISPPPDAFLATVRADERWVYVDRDHQVLVAYVGRTPVMATLVSTGRTGFATSRGEYRIVRKRPVGTMRDYDPGRGDRPYFIAGIPDIQYFHRGQAFHAAFWHDRFGTRTSHGCVNLSLADAQWLFDFTDPMPEDGATENRPQGTLTDPPAPWPQTRHGHGSRVFVHGVEA